MTYQERGQPVLRRMKEATPGTPLQMHLFDEELTDTRTRKQKRLARQREGWQQGEMFSQRELAQWGVRVHPMNLTARNGQPLGMQLEIQDPRSEEQRVADLQLEAESQTYRMFRERPDLYVARPDEAAMDFSPLPVETGEADVLE